MLPHECEDYFFIKNKTNIVTIIEKKTRYVKGKDVIFLEKSKIMSNHVILFVYMKKSATGLLRFFVYFNIPLKLKYRNRLIYFFHLSRITRLRRQFLQQPHLVALQA